MLANGAKLGFKTSSSATSYTNLIGLKEIPDITTPKEKVANNDLAGAHSEYGIADLPDLVYKFRYVNTSTTDPYPTLLPLDESNAVVYFQEEDPDGTKITFSGNINVTRGGGQLNGAIEMTLSIALAAKVTVTQPTRS